MSSASPDAGLLQLDPITTGNSDIADAFIAKLAELLTSNDAYPLFDDETGALVREGVAEGRFAISASAARRGKQAAAATGFIDRMPSLPRASMDQVLQIREELQESLSRFRRAVIRISRLMETGIESDDFSAELQDLYDSEVAPVLEEIAAAFTRNVYLRELLGAAVEDARSLLAYAAGLVLGVTDPAHLPGLASAAVGVATAATPIGAQVLVRAQRARSSARADQLFFLYEAEQRLQRG